MLEIILSLKPQNLAQTPPSLLQPIAPLSSKNTSEEIFQSFLPVPPLVTFLFKNRLLWRFWKLAAMFLYDLPQRCLSGSWGFGLVFYSCITNDHLWLFKQPLIWGHNSFLHVRKSQQSLLEPVLWVSQHAIKMLLASQGPGESLTSWTLSDC